MKFCARYLFKCIKCSILSLKCCCFCTQLCQINNTNELEHHNPKASVSSKTGKIEAQGRAVILPCHSTGVRYKKKKKKSESESNASQEGIKKTNIYFWICYAPFAVKPEWKYIFTLLTVRSKYKIGIPETLKGELTAIYN